MQKFDVIVVGGGINGVGIAREAQLAGYKTLLVERDDFGSGTTSRATRLIHGGLRYLEHGELGLVSESLREREDLVRTAPHLVRPLRLLLPGYRGEGSRRTHPLRHALAAEVASAQQQRPEAPPRPHRARSRARRP
jgi:glycerol-3-phosphate dehydrogenase